MRDDLEVACRTAAAGDDAELAARVAPRDGRTGAPRRHIAIGDEGEQPGAAQPEGGEQVAHRVGGDGAVAQQQLDVVGARHPEGIELHDVGRQLHERRHARVAGELGVLHDPAAGGGIAHEEVGEAHEVGGGEGRLVDDLGIGAQCLVGALHRVGEGCGIRRPGLGDLDHLAGELVTVRLEHAVLVRHAQAAGALEREVHGLLDGRHAPQLRVDRAEPRELAFGRGLQVARAPDDSGFVLDVSHVHLSPSTLAAGSDSARLDG